MPVHKYKLAKQLQKPGLKTHVMVEDPLSPRDVTTLHKHCREQVLTLSRIKADSLDFLADWADLRDLRLYSCKIGDWSALGKLKKLHDLFLNGLGDRSGDLSFLSQLRQLKELTIGNIAQLTALPDLSRCTRLKRLEVFGCKRLADLSEVLRIPNLESFQISHLALDPSSLQPIMAMPKMKRMSGVFGTKKRNDLFRLLLVQHGVAYG